MTGDVESLRLPSLSTPHGRRGSRLGRLFLYSKDSLSIALENFTTEALAQATTDDPRPLLAELQSLARRCRAPFDMGDALDLRAATQVFEAGGFLDLVLEVVGEGGTVLGVVWVEIKTGSPESGTQLDAYLLAALSARRPTWLVTLGPTRLREDIAHVDWLGLYQRARRTPREHRSWHDLRRFLEEQMVASDALGPVTDREAASIEAAHGLMQKASAVVAEAYKLLSKLVPPTTWERLKWPSEAALLNAAAATFRKSGQFHGFSAGLYFGIMAEEGTAYWFVTMSAEPQSREDSLRSAAKGRFDTAQWDHHATGPDIVTSRVRATSIGSHAAIVAWFGDRLREVATSRLLELSLGLPVEVPKD